MKLIINADDFGYSKSVTDGIVDCIRAGVVTSTTLMINMPWSDYAISRAIELDLDCIGLHVNLTVGKPLTRCPSLCGADGNFLYIDKQKTNTKINEAEVYSEIRSQLEYAMRKGIKVTHIDSHHFSRENPVIGSAALCVAREFGLAMRNEGKLPKDIKTTDIFCKEFFGDNVSVDTLKDVLKKYKGSGKTVELMCHPGYMDAYTMSMTSYKQRDKEIEILLKAKREEVFDGVALIGFGGLK